MITLQPDLFGPPAPAVPFQRGSATSRAAADRVRPAASNHEQLVYDAIVAAGTRGITRKELAAQLSFAEQQQNRITGRVAALLAKGVIREVQEWSVVHGVRTIVKRRRDGSVILTAVRAGSGL